MARPQKYRKICSPPVMLGFRPFGLKANNSSPVCMKLEEYESIKLIHYSGLQQNEAAISMNISRPTFTRIYNNALRQITRAFVEGRVLTIEGGNFELDRDWYRCKKCFALIEGLNNHLKCRKCNCYSRDELIKINQ